MGGSQGTLVGWSRRAGGCCTRGGGQKGGRGVCWDGWTRRAAVGARPRPARSLKRLSLPLRAPPGGAAARACPGVGRRAAGSPRQHSSPPDGSARWSGGRDTAATPGQPRMPRVGPPRRVPCARPAAAAMAHGRATAAAPLAPPPRRAGGGGGGRGHIQRSCAANRKLRVRECEATGTT